MLHIHQLGPLTITTPTTTPADITYQLNTLRGHRFLTLDASGTPTTTTPVLFDPYGNQLTNTNNSTVDDPDTPDYAWHANNNAETETLELPYVMMGARVYVPELGRFTSPDPIPGASGSEYSYARSDPINF
ncbi:MAG: RHS repeat-associated core domain-containing protein, partial [Actinomycetota bacterium]